MSRSALERASWACLVHISRLTPDRPSAASLHARRVKAENYPFGDVFIRLSRQNQLLDVVGDSSRLLCGERRGDERGR